MRTFALPALVLVLSGCAAVFRDSKPKVRIESTPPGAEATTQSYKTPVVTPGVMPVSRGKTINLKVAKSGYADKFTVIPKKLNVGWVIADVLTCPISLCIPLLVDAISGAWNDVPKKFEVALDPQTPGAATAASTSSEPPPVASATPAPASMLSESERKSAARAAFIEGAQLQEKKDCARALPRFQAAQKLYQAPTHLLHIGQCQMATGKLVEAHETFETLSRVSLEADASPVFKQAKATAKEELPALEARIPKLRITVTPPASQLHGLAVQVNGRAIPPALIGIARPVNPGKYRVTASSQEGASAPVEVDLAEGASKSIELKLPHRR